MLGGNGYASMLVGNGYAYRLCLAMLVANARRGSLFTMQVVHWLYARLGGLEAWKLVGIG